MWLGQSGVIAWRKKGGLPLRRQHQQACGPRRPSGGRDGAKLADGLWEGGLKKGASGKEAEADGDSRSGCRDGQR